MNYDFVDGILWYVVFLFSTCCHEAAHAWSAYRLGDNTAYNGGQVTLNPAPHVRREPLGMVIVPWLSFVLGGFMIGWASAPYDPHWALRYPKRSGMMALAGPAANLLLVVCAAVLMIGGCKMGIFDLPDFTNFSHIVDAKGGTEGVAALYAQLISLFFSLNLLLGLFNLLPCPPLDGSSIPMLFLPQTTAEKYWHFMNQPAFAWLGLIIAWRLFDHIFAPVFIVARHALYMVIGGLL